MSEHIFQTDEFDGVFSVFVAPNIGISNITGQREEIVRCRDCIHFRPGKPKTSAPSRRTGVFTFVHPDPDGFCAWGERR